MLQAKLSVATVGFYLGTIWLGLFLGVLVFKEKLTVAGVLGFFFALAGLVFLLAPLGLF